MAGNQNANDPIFPAAQALAGALQPANVQMGILINLMKELTDAAAKRTKGEGEQTEAMKKNHKGMGELLGLVRTGVTSAMATAAGAITGMIGQVQGLLGQFVGAFRPDAMERFKTITNDLMASIGEILVPVLQAANRVFRWIGDTIVSVTATVVPMVRALIAAADPLFKMLGDGIRQLINTGALAASMKLIGSVIGLVTASFSSLIPLVVQVVRVFQAIQTNVANLFAGLFTAIRPIVAFVGSLIGSILKPLMTAFADIFTTLVDVVGLLLEIFGELVGVVLELLKPAIEFLIVPLRLLAEGLTWVAKKVRDLLNQLRDFLGLDPLGAERSGSSLGKGATQASFTSTDEIWKNMQKATFGAGRGESEKDMAPVKSAGHLENIWNFINGEVRPWLAEKRGQIGRVQQVAESSSPAGAAAAYLLEMYKRQQLVRT
jgi:hypothetical protein